MRTKNSSTTAERDELREHTAADEGSQVTGARSMNTNQNPSNLLRLRAEMIRQSLPDLCRKENRTPTSALRVAFHLVDGEDLDGKPPQNYTPAIAAAMKYHRCLHQAEEPDYPESARRRYVEQNVRFEKFMADFKKKVTKSDDDGRTV
jgi:hypothetical protein